MDEPVFTLPVVLSIAGSDSSGGAGILADTKTITALGAYATVAITVVTAQNTKGVAGVVPLSPEFVVAQMDAVFEDLNPKAIKLGMLHHAAIIKSVHHHLKKQDFENLVIDPVMVATAGSLLLEANAVKSLKDLLPMATLMTPNLHEAKVLLDTDNPIKKEDMASVAKELARRYQTSVLLKGGHLQGVQEMIDILYDFENQEIHQYRHPYVMTANTHGTGCSLSAAIAAYLARGENLATATRLAGDYLHLAIKKAASLRIAAGNGPVLVGYVQSN